MAREELSGKGRSSVEEGASSLMVLEISERVDEAGSGEEEEDDGEEEISAEEVGSSDSDEVVIVGSVDRDESEEREDTVDEDSVTDGNGDSCRDSDELGRAVDVGDDILDRTLEVVGRASREDVLIDDLESVLRPGRRVVSSLTMAWVRVMMARLSGASRGASMSGRYTNYQAVSRQSTPTTQLQKKTQV